MKNGVPELTGCWQHNGELQDHNTWSDIKTIISAADLWTYLMEEFDSPDPLYNPDASLNLPNSKELVSDKIIPFDKVRINLSIDADYLNRTLNIIWLRERLDSLEKSNQTLMDIIYRLERKLIN